MHVRTSIIFALSMLTLGACVSHHPSVPHASTVKDRAYYFQHLDEAQAKKEQCLKDRVFEKAGVDMENSRDQQMIAAYPDDLLMLNQDNAELFSCIAAWTAANSAEPLRKWQRENEESEATNQKFEAQVMRFKAELEKKYSEIDWKKFYPAALYQESVHFLYTDSTSEEYAKKEAIERIFIDKAKRFIAESEANNIETLTQKMSQICKEDTWGYIPSCKVYYHVLKEKLSKKTLSELVEMEKQYNDGEHMPVPILFEAYRFTLGSALEKINRELMSDYGKLDSEYRQCVKKIGEKVSVTQMDSFEENFEPEFYLGFYPECAVTDNIMKQLEFPLDLNVTVESKIFHKIVKQSQEENEKFLIDEELSGIAWRKQLEESPEVLQTKKSLAQKYAQTPWQNFRSTIKQDYPDIESDFSGTEEEQKQKKIISTALRLILIEKIQPEMDKLEKKSIDELLTELRARCKEGEGIDWLSDTQCILYYRTFLKKIQGQTLEELLASKDKYEEGPSLVKFSYKLVLEGKEVKRSFELIKNDDKREAAYWQCIKNISKTIKKSGILETNDAESIILNEPGCKQVYYVMSNMNEEKRFTYFADTLLNKKRFKEAPKVQQD